MTQMIFIRLLANALTAADRTTRRAIGGAHMFGPMFVSIDIADTIMRSHWRPTFARIANLCIAKCCELASIPDEIVSEYKQERAS